MPKITFMGAGSTVFAKNVLGDSMMTPALEESTIALYDIDATRLNESKAMLEAINRNNGSKAHIEAYLGVDQRKEALRGANYVPFRSADMIPARSLILKFPKNMVCARPLRIPWVLAVYSGPFGPFPSCWILPGIWKRSARMPGSSIIPIPWPC